MGTRFRNRTMRREYEAAIRAYELRHPNLFLPSGERRRSPNLGSSFATFFWGGFDGEKLGLFNFEKGQRDVLAYAYYVAGQQARKETP